MIKVSIKPQPAVRIRVGDSEKLTVKSPAVNYLAKIPSNYGRIEFDGAKLRIV